MRRVRNIFQKSVPEESNTAVVAELKIISLSQCLLWTSVQYPKLSARKLDDVSLKGEFPLLLRHHRDPEQGSARWTYFALDKQCAEYRDMKLSPNKSKILYSSSNPRAWNDGLPKEM